MSQLDTPDYPLEKVTRGQLVQTINEAIKSFLINGGDALTASQIGIVAIVGPISTSGSFVIAKLDDLLLRQYFVTDLL